MKTTYYAQPICFIFFFFSSRRRHTRYWRDWSSDVCSSDLPNKAAAVTIGAADLGGVVTGKTGPEAGVWVIAEATDLPTKFAKIVVTDDRGRYVIPDLPKATYNVWTRGYGLVDSPKVKAALGKNLNLTAVPAPTAAPAAEYYPRVHWHSM